jgi:hypothetical protein
MVHPQDPQERLANARKDFGEWGGVNASIEVSTTFTGKWLPFFEPVRITVIQPGSIIVHVLPSSVSLAAAISGELRRFNSSC